MCQEWGEESGIQKQIIKLSCPQGTQRKHEILYTHAHTHRHSGSNAMVGSCTKCRGRGIKEGFIEEVPFDLGLEGEVYLREKGPEPLWSSQPEKNPKYVCVCINVHVHTRHAVCSNEHMNKVHGEHR